MRVHRINATQLKGLAFAVDSALKRVASHPAMTDSAFPSAEEVFYRASAFSGMVYEVITAVRGLKSESPAVPFKPVLLTLRLPIERGYLANVLPALVTMPVDVEPDELLAAVLDGKHLRRCRAAVDNGVYVLFILGLPDAGGIVPLARSLKVVLSCEQLEVKPADWEDWGSYTQLLDVPDELALELNDLVVSDLYAASSIAELLELYCGIAWNYEELGFLATLIGKRMLPMLIQDSWVGRAQWTSREEEIVYAWQLLVSVVDNGCGSRVKLWLLGCEKCDGAFWGYSQPLEVEVSRLAHEKYVMLATSHLAAVVNLLDNKPLVASALRIASADLLAEFSREMIPVLRRTAENNLPDRIEKSDVDIFDEGFWGGQF